MVYVGVQKTGTEIATMLNIMDVSSDEYVLKLKHEIEEQCLVSLEVTDQFLLLCCLSVLIFAYLLYIYAIWND